MNFPNHIIADILTVLILVFSVLYGRKNGLIKTLSGVISLFLAFSLAGTLATSTTPYVSERFVAPYFQSRIESEAVDQDLPQTGLSIDSQQKLEEFLTSLGLPTGIVLDTVSDLAESLSKSFIEPIKVLSNTVSFKITYAILFIIYFIVLRILLFFVFKLFNLTAKLPVVNFINKSMGLIFGAVFGYLIIITLSFILIKSGLFLTRDIIYETSVLKYLIHCFPLSFL